MKKELKICIVACLLLFSLNSAQADLMLKSVDGNWSNPIGGTNIFYDNAVPVAFGNTKQDQIRWGTSTGQGQSGVGFTGIADDTTIGLGTPFMIGRLFHFNRPIGSGTAAKGVDLTVTLEFDDFEPFIFKLGINETPNSPPHGGYGTSDDFIYFPNSFVPRSFDIGGLPYTLTLLGFGLDPSNLDTFFQSPEGGDNRSFLWGEINLVPVPGAVLLGILGLGAAGLKLRRFA